MSKTVSQLAVEIGVTSQTVRKKIKKLGLQTDLQTNGNAFVIDERTEIVLKQAFRSDDASQFANETQTDANSLQVGANYLQAGFSDVLDVFREQLKEKDHQLAEKDKQIAMLTETLKTQAQSINADRHAELAGKLQETPMLISDNTTKLKFKERLKFLFKGGI